MNDNKTLWVIEEAGLYGNSNMTAFCPFCNHYVNWFEEYHSEAIIRELPNYCSYCGKDMRKEENA